LIRKLDLNLTIPWSIVFLDAQMLRVDRLAVVREVVLNEFRNSFRVWDVRCRLGLA